TPVFSRPATRVLRRGQGRRRGGVAHLLADHAATGTASTAGCGALKLRLDLARVLRAPHLPVGPQPVSTLPAPLRLSGPAHDRLELAVSSLDARDPAAGRPLFLRPALLPGGPYADWPQGLIAISSGVVSLLQWMPLPPACPAHHKAV